MIALLLKGLSRGGGDSIRNFVLHGEDVGEFPIELLTPELIAGCSVDQLRRDAHAVCRSPDAPIQKERHSELFSDGPHVDRATPKCEAG